MLRKQCRYTGQFGVGAGVVGLEGVVGLVGWFLWLFNIDLIWIFSNEFSQHGCVI